jgi:predicted Zn-dependent protease
MIQDPYSPCSCGSGKKAKWCCQPIHEQVSKILAMDEQGQHEAALRAMDALVAEHPSNAEAWGRKALLLLQNQKIDEAESALAKAFELFPTYPYGFFLKAQIKKHEHNIGEAVQFLRNAAEHYDPNAIDILAQLYLEIFECEMQLNHPVAARAALEVARRLIPSDERLRQSFDAIFSKDSPNLPASAWQAYTFKTLGPQASPERKTAWEQSLKAGQSGKLGDAVKAFEQLTQDAQAEPAAWYNLALCQAWSGNNQPAVEALDRYVSSEADVTQAAAAWALAEVLRFGHGMEDQADVVEYSIVFALRNPEAFVQELGELERAGLLAGARVNQEEGVLNAVILEPPPPALTPELAAKQSLKPAAYLTLISNVVRLWNSRKDAIDAAFERLQQKLGEGIAQTQSVRGPAQFFDAIAEGVQVPRGATTEAEALQRQQEGFQKFFEEVWIHRPLKSLSNNAPVDAAGHAVLGKKLRGLVQFLQECAELKKINYDFQRLLRKLGLAEGVAATESATTDFGAMSAGELAAVSAESLSSAQLDQAYQAAIKLDARDLAAHFAGLLVDRPPYAERSDRFPLHQYLINHSTASGNLDAALDHLNAGESDDCSNNEGRRRNEYELRRAQLHAKRGELDDAERVYDALIARTPNELNVRVNAAETMLSARQGSKALKYAKEGLAAALKANNRDLEGHFKELMAAAQR